MHDRTLGTGESKHLMDDRTLGAGGQSGHWMQDRILNAGQNTGYRGVKTLNG